jgi:hypothetical protein
MNAPHLGAWAVGFALAAGAAAAQPSPPISERAETARRGLAVSPDPIECIAKPGGGLAMSVKRDRDLDSYRILFEMENEDMYLNILDKRCRHLGKNNSVAYQVKANARQGVCRGDILHVTSPHGQEIGRCKLGAFFRLYED